MMAEIIPLPDTRPGAMPGDWAHFDLVLGLAADLLPVVSNLKATISPDSNMGGVGKTPSIYNSRRQVAGLPGWTQRHSTPEQVAGWMRERDYGICLQTRRIRALDVDIPDPDQAKAVREFIAARFDLPARTRGNASKFLLAFDCAGELYKRKLKTSHGIIELLATGQQFIACGTHTSGARYEWREGLPDAFPVLSLAQVDALWSALEAEFAVEASASSTASTKALKLADAVQADPLARHLLDKGWVKAGERDGRLHITCPWEHEHTTDSGDSATTYWPAHTGGYERGHFHCLHSHCEHREDHEFADAVGYVEPMADEFARIADDDGPMPIEDVGSIDTPAPMRFGVEDAHRFADAPLPTWIIKGVLPRAELAVLFGESGSGKSFIALDMAASIARGVPWRGLTTKQGRVVYVAAEGAGGFRKRLKAYAHQHCIRLDDLRIGVIAGTPNLREKADALDISKAIKAWGGADLVIVDTFAQAMAGANENSGEDVGRALAHCKGIHKATGAPVVLVHHSGKDSSKGARGWSGLRAAADVELEVMRVDDDRCISVTKQKDGEDGSEFGFRLLTVVVGVDSDGEDITSCVVEHHDDPMPEVRGKGRQKAKTGSIESVVLAQLDDLLAMGVPDFDEEKIIKAVVDALPEKRDSKGRDRRREHVRGAIDSLCASGAVFVVDGRIAKA